MAKKTRTELSTLAVNTNLPDNTSEQITPTTERAQLTEERDSVINYKDDLGGTSNAGKFLTVGADGESLTMVDGATGDVTGTGVTGRVTIWDGTNSITSKAMLVLDDTNKILKIVIPSANASGGISIDQQGTTGTSSLQFLDDSVYKAQIVYDVSDGNLTLNSNGNINITPTGDTVISGGTPSVEHVRILSGGAVGIGISSPTSYNASGDNLVIGSTSDNNNGITIVSPSGGSANDSRGNIYFADATNDTSGFITYKHRSDAEQMLIGVADSVALTINSSGIVGSGLLTISAGSSSNPRLVFEGADVSGTHFIQIDRGTSSMEFYVNGATRAEISSGGLATFSNGIKFGSGATLEYYEEGTWTPTVTSGYTSVSYTAQNGFYTRIGNVVTAYYRVQFTGTADQSRVQLNGLPINSSMNTKGGSLNYHSITFNGSPTPYPSNTTIDFYRLDTTNAFANSVSNVNGDFLIGFVTYTV